MSPCLLVCHGRRNLSLRDNSCIRRDVACWTQKSLSMFSDRGQTTMLICLLLLTGVETEPYGTITSPVETFLAGLERFPRFFVATGVKQQRPCSFVAWASKRSIAGYSFCWVQTPSKVLFSDRTRTAMRRCPLFVVSVEAD